MLTLLGRAGSINVRKVRWLLDELGLVDGQHFRHEAEWGEGRSLRSAEFLALNPDGLVPVLRIGDGGSAAGQAVLTESNTICRYLAGRADRTDLLPTEPLARAQVERWMDWQATELNTAWRPAFMALVRRHPDFADAARVAASVAQWHARMGLLDAHLAAHGGPFVCGPAFTLADIVLGLSTQRWLATPMDRPALPAVVAWHARLLQRPGFRAHGANGVP